MKTNIIYLLLLVSAFLWSCSKIDSEFPMEEPISAGEYVDYSAKNLDEGLMGLLKNLKVNQGILTFNNTDEFQIIYEFIMDNQMDDEFLLKVFKKNTDFVSAREFFDNHMNKIEDPAEFIKAAESDPIIFEKVYSEDGFYYDLNFLNVSSYPISNLFN